MNLGFQQEYPIGIIPENQAIPVNEGHFGSSSFAAGFQLGRQLANHQDRNNANS